MAINTAIPARPALDNSRCTCVWPDEYARQARIVDKYQDEQDKVDAIQSPLTTLSAIPSKVAYAVTSHMPGSLGGSTVPSDTPMPDAEPSVHAVDGEKAHLEADATLSQRTSVVPSIAAGPARQSAGISPAQTVNPEAEKRLSAKSSNIKKGYSQKTVTIPPARGVKRVFRFTCMYLRS